MTTKLKDSYGKVRFIIVVRDGGEYEVCADHLQEALDFIIDYWDEQDTDNQSSHFLDLSEYKESQYEWFISGGNAGRYTSYTGDDIHVTSEEENPIYDFEVETE